MKAVLFDLGGTLIKTAPVPDILKRLLEDFGIRRSLNEIAAAQIKVEEGLTLEDYALSSLNFWTTWNMRILGQLRIHENLKAMAEDIVNRWWDNADVELYPDVIEILGKLKSAKIKMGIVTNGFQSDIDAILARIDLTGFFNATVGVDAVKKPKPCREIFIYALEKIGVSPREVLFVGDNFTTDYEGATNVGLGAILIDRDNNVRRRTRRIRDLRELARYL